MEVIYDFKVKDDAIVAENTNPLENLNNPKNITELYATNYTIESGYSNKNSICFSNNDGGIALATKEASNKFFLEIEFKPVFSQEELSSSVAYYCIMGMWNPGGPVINFIIDVYPDYCSFNIRRYPNNGQPILHTVVLKDSNGNNISKESFNNKWHRLQFYCKGYSIVKLKFDNYEMNDPTNSAYFEGIVGAHRDIMYDINGSSGRRGSNGNLDHFRVLFLDNNADETTIDGIFSESFSEIDDPSESNAKSYKSILKIY